MPFSERDLSHDGPGRDVTRPSRSRPEAQSSGATARVLNLQRLAGNAAVTAAMQSGALGGAGGPLPVQRMAEDEEQENDAEAEG